MKIVFLGNFGVSYSSENHHVKMGLSAILLLGFFCSYYMVYGIGHENNIFGKL